MPSTAAPSDLTPGAFEKAADDYIAASEEMGRLWDAYLAAKAARHEAWGRMSCYLPPRVPGAAFPAPVVADAACAVEGGHR